MYFSWKICLAEYENYSLHIFFLNFTRLKYFCIIIINKNAFFQVKWLQNKAELLRHNFKINNLLFLALFFLLLFKENTNRSMKRKQPKSVYFILILKLKKSRRLQYELEKKERNHIHIYVTTHICVHTYT